jgi:hypothetical protein
MDNMGLMIIYLEEKGNIAMKRARLIALASLRWCFAQTPLRLRGTILPYEDKYLCRSWLFL